MIPTKIEEFRKKTISEDDFPEIEELISELQSEVKNGKITRREIFQFNQGFGAEFLENTIQGYGLRKPFGYAGDFLMIDKIYTYHKSPIKKYGAWDEYFHQQSAPKAVRNRKAYFKKIMSLKIQDYSRLSLLNVASGPARDLFEFYEQHPTHEFHTTCIEMDENAIKYAKDLNQKHLDKISFIHQNIFRYKGKDKFDVIWSAGLFDYFNDKAFVMILKRLKEFLNPKGEIIIGNFNENHNPSRNYMELLGDWFLYHRTNTQLIELAKKAKFKPADIKIGREAENVNLFLHLRNQSKS